MDLNVFQKLNLEQRLSYLLAVEHSKEMAKLQAISQSIPYQMFNKPLPLYPKMLTSLPKPVESPTYSRSSCSPSTDDGKGSPFVYNNYTCTNTFASEDSPIDLSKPKRSPASIPSLHSDKVSLEYLLTGQKRKRSQPSDIPLNLSFKKARTAELSQSHIPHPANSQFTRKVYSIEEATDNPVQLVDLANESLTKTQASMSHYMVKMIQKLISLKLFTSMDKSEQLSQITRCWHRLLMWLCAANDLNFQFVCRSKEDISMNNKQSMKDSINQPTMAFVKTISSFIRKYRELGIDETEMTLLFGLTFINTGLCMHSFNQPTIAEIQKKELMAALHKYVGSKCMDTKTNRYADLLLCLPMLYGINESMFTRLFFQHIPMYNISARIEETLIKFTEHPLTL